MINTKKIHHRLKKKGWDKNYISKTHHILKNAEKKKHPHIKKLDKALFWVVIFVLIVSNTLIFTGLMPVIAETPAWFSVLIFSIFGLLSGLFFDVLFQHSNLDFFKYFLTALIIPITSTISLLFILNFTKDVLKEIGIFISINPLILIVFYTFFFLIPHTVYLIKNGIN